MVYHLTPQRVEPPSGGVQDALQRIASELTLVDVTDLPALASRLRSIQRVAERGAQVAEGAIPLGDWSDPEDDLLLARERAGVTLWEIAAELGRHRIQVRRRLRWLTEVGRRALPANHGMRWSPSDHVRAAELMADGATAEEIAETLGRTTTAIKIRFFSEEA